MTRRVRANADFARDVTRQIGFLIDEGRPTWVEMLANDIRELETMLAEFPAVGHYVGPDGSGELRRIQLRHVPFRALYWVDRHDPAGPVELLRLFHVRQRAPL